MHIWIHVEMERQCALLGCPVLRNQAHQEVVDSDIDDLDGDSFAETYDECFVMAYIIHLQQFCAHGCLARVVLD